MNVVYLILFDDPPDQRKDYVITGWGRTHEGNKTVSVTIHGYMPYFSIIGKRRSDGEYLTPDQLNTVIFEMESGMKGDWNKPKYKNYNKKRTVYYYNEVTVCTVYFHSMAAYHGYRKKVRDYQHPHAVLETSDDSASTLIKFFGERDVAPCTWLTIDATPLPLGHPSRVSTCEVEFSIRYNAIARTSPTINTLPNFKRFVYDIECYGSNEFGMPKAWKVTDEIITISVDVSDTDNTFSENHQFCQAKIAGGVGKSILHSYNSEKELLLGFFQFLYETDPDILETYNGFGFDNPYIHGRYSRYFTYYQKLGRSFIYESEWKDKGIGGYSGKTSFLYNNDRRVKMHGRFDLDLYNIIKKEEGRRMKKNTLDVVAKAILGRGKLDMDFRRGFESFRNHKLFPEDEYWQGRMKEFLEYAGEDTCLTREIANKKRTIPNLFMSSSNFGIPPFQLYIGGQQQKLVAMIHREAYKLGITLNHRDADYVDYGGGIVEHPVPGYYTKVFVVDFAGMYPSIMLDKNICLSTYIPPHQRHLFKEDDVWMIQTRRGPIHWFVKQPDVDNEGKDIPHPVRRRGLIPMIVLKIITGRADVKAKLKGVIDAATRAVLVILELFLKESANSMYGVLGVQNKKDENGKSSNSGKFSCVEAAEAVTDTGALYITQVRDEMTTVHNCDVPYGDTDSKFGKSRDPNRNPHECMRTVATEVTRKLFGPKSPVKVEPEKVIDMILLMPKKYIYILINEECKRMIDDKKTLDDEFGDKLKTKEGVLSLLRDPKSRAILQRAVKTKGDVMVRKDSCDWQREVYFDVAFCCFYDFTFEDIVELIYEHIRKLFNGEVNIADLTYVARYRASAGSDYYVTKFVDSLRAFGYDIEDGAGLDFVIAETGSKKTAEKMRMPEMLGNYRIDYLHYLDKLIAHVDAVVWARFGTENYFRQVYYSTPYTEISVLSPCKMLYQIIKDGKYPTEYILYLSRCTSHTTYVTVTMEQYQQMMWEEYVRSQQPVQPKSKTVNPTRMYM